MPVPSMIRTRWAAVGAAVAVSVGAGGVGLLQATAPSGAAAFVPITPCRLFDTRPAPHTVGDRTSPLGPDETYDVAARGAQGNCTLPNSAVGIVLNVTAVDATQATFLTLFPSGVERPTASHLNPTPGAPPAPNAVTVDLSSTGEFSVFNRFGSVHVLADVVGYYTDHHHDDRYYAPGSGGLAGDVAALLALETVTVEAPVNPAANFPGATAECPAASHAIAGAASAAGGPVQLFLSSSQPTDDGTGWQAGFVTADQAAPGSGGTMTVTVKCSRLPLHETVSAVVDVDRDAPTVNATVECPTGTHAVGGGGRGTAPGAVSASPYWLLDTSEPTLDGLGWYVEFDAQVLSWAPSDKPTDKVTVVAICSELDLGAQ
jgi:hypothetical protein